MRVSFNNGMHLFTKSWDLDANKIVVGEQNFLLSKMSQLTIKDPTIYRYGEIQFWYDEDGFNKVHFAVCDKEKAHEAFEYMKKYSK